MTCGSTNLTDEKTSKTSKRRADSSNNSTHPTVSLDLISKRAKIEVTLAASEAGQMTQIESEFQILKSLIPNIANKQQINEVRIIYEFKIIVEGRNKKIFFSSKIKIFFIATTFFFCIWNISNLEMFTCVKYIQKQILKSSEIYLCSSWKSLMHVSVILKLCNHNWNWLNQYRIITN